MHRDIGILIYEEQYEMNVKFFNKLLFILSLTLACGAHATVINSISGGGTANPFSAINQFTGGPISENGFTWTSTYSSSVYGWNSGYGLANNGSWTNNDLIGLNSASGYMTINFDTAVSSVLAFLNYAPGNGTAYMAAYDASNNLIENYFLNISTPNATNGGQDFGFNESSNIIKSFVLGGAYIVASNLHSDSSSVPEPTPLALLAIGLVGLGAIRRRKTN